jgi:hypothetical protein
LRRTSRRSIAAASLPQTGEVIGQHGADHTGQGEPDEHGRQRMAEEIFQ